MKSMKPKTEEEIARERVLSGNYPWSLRATTREEMKLKTEEERARETVPDGYAFDKRTGKREIPAGSMRWSEFHQEWCDLGRTYTNGEGKFFALKVKTEEEMARECVPDGYEFDERTGVRGIPAGSMFWSHIQQTWDEVNVPHITYGIGYYALKVTPPVKTEEELARECVPDGFVFDERTGKRDVPVGSRKWNKANQKWYETKSPHTTYGSGYYALKVTLPSRRFRCANCGIKCRSSKADRGNRQYCRPCEDGIKFSYEWK
jgi:hypothetical protein